MKPSAADYRADNSSATDARLLLNARITFEKCGQGNILALGKLILPELNALRGSFLDSLGLSKASLQRKKASIKIWFDFLHLNFPKLITFTPKLDSDRYKLTRTTKGTTKALELEEWFRLKQALAQPKKNPRLLVLCQTALLLGGRRIGKLLSLKWSDIDFEKEIVVIGLPGREQTPVNTNYR